LRGLALPGGKAAFRTVHFVEMGFVDFGGGTAL
jgi:hypothetical protein